MNRQRINLPSNCIMKTLPFFPNRLVAMQNITSTSRARRAFTLVELLVVLAIIGILASFLLPALARAKTKAHNAVCINNLRQLGIAVRLYSEDNNNRLPIAEILPTQPLDPQTPLPRICDVLAR